MQKRNNNFLTRFYRHCVRKRKQGFASLTSLGNKKNLQGLTLIELLIVFAIISIVSAIVLLNFSTNRSQKQVEMAAREVSGVFHEAQNYSLTGKQAVPGTSPCKFTVSWAASSYSIVYWYKDASGNCVLQSNFRTYVLSNGVTFSNSNNLDTSGFTLPHAATLFGSTLAVNLVKSGYYRSVCVSTSGLISEVSGQSCP